MPVVLSQTINTPATPAAYYELSFWVSGEDAASGGFAERGIFGLQLTNVLPGDPIQYLAVPVNAVPEPGTLALLAAGLATIAARERRRRALR